MSNVRDVLLTRRGVLFLGEADAVETRADEGTVRAFAVELANVGYVPSARLHARLQHVPPLALRELRDRTCATLLAHAGDLNHVPLFRDFPQGVPANTNALWWKKVLVHFLQREGQTCLFCGAIGTTHVLQPCEHVVCDRCFDGANYSACPSCEHAVDRSSPFFLPSPERGFPNEKVIFKRLDLGIDLDAETRAFFESLCARRQALSPTDREALVVIVRDRGMRVLDWLPETIPLRENIATIFGTLFAQCDPSSVLPHARRYLTTATDVLRLIAVYSGTDGSLLPETVYRDTLIHNAARTRFWQRIAAALGADWPPLHERIVKIPIRVRRFKVGKLRRPLRRALLDILESFDADRLAEDMLRHRSYWVWVGEFLHPSEYAKRYPNVARAFEIVRTKKHVFATWYARLEQRIRSKDATQIIELLTQRPGELARRLDHALRVTGDRRVLDAFGERIEQIATPVLLTLASHLPLRDTPAAVRVYWPKGRVAMGASSADRRAVLPRAIIDDGVRMIEAELLRRFAQEPAFPQCIVDDALSTIAAPFNERTSSAASVALPRGSRIAVPQRRLARLFLHWCEPPRNRNTTDLDLSVAFYDANWTYLGVCSYYQLQFADVAKSAGDLRNAPWPDGATEFVDVDLDAARANGVRYAVTVINNYAGLPFSLLVRGFAGVMFRDDPMGHHFDPRTVELRFTVAGDNGIFLPLVLDVEAGMLHWLDVQSRGKLELNNVATSNKDITKLCPRLMTYFASGTRASMFDLALLHAAARSRRVVVRGEASVEFVRGAQEDVVAFHRRLREGRADGDGEIREEPSLAFLYRGDIELPDGSSSAYRLF